MKNINKIEVSQFKETMSSLEISQITGKEHKNVLRDIRKLIDSLIGSDVSSLNFSDDYHREDRTQYKYLSNKSQKYILNFCLDNKAESPYKIKESEYIDSKGEKRELYVLNKKACFLLASGYNTLLRAKIINRWEELETKNKSNDLTFNIPQTFSQALMLAAKQAEQIEQQNKLIEVKDTQILELKPKATYYDTILSSKKAECISVFSKYDYGISGMAMNKLLHDWGIQYKVGKTWLPYQKYASLGYTKTETITINEDKDTVIQTKWTQQGRLFIYEQMKKHGYLPLIEK